MKRIFYSICLLFLLSGVKAQFQAGQKMIGGQLFFNTNSVSAPSNFASPSPSVGQRTTSLGLNLSFSRFKNATTLNGMGISYTHSHNKINIGTPFESTSSMHSVGLFANKTKLQKLAKDFYLTFTGTAFGNYQFGNGTLQFQNRYPEKFRGYGLGVSGSAGLMYQLNKRFVISGDLSNLVRLSYTCGKYTNSVTDNITKYDSFGFSTGLSGFTLGNLSFGVQYLL
jgi:hypothetical protein